MKTKQKLFALLLTLVLVLSLAACGGKSSAMDTGASGATGGSTGSASNADKNYGSDVYYEPSAPEMEAPAPDAKPGESSSSADPLQGRKFIITADLTLETTEFDAAIDAIDALAKSFGGWFESSSISNRGNGSRWANYTVRIPADRYEEFLNQAGELCHETRRNSNRQEITDSYYDVQGRLKTQQIKLERLQSLLAKAVDMKDIITLEGAISDTEYEIERLSGTLRQYDSKVDYATVYLNLQEVYKLSNVETVPETFGQRLGDSFLRGLESFGNTLENLAVSFAYSWMWWLIIVAVAVVVVRVVLTRTGKVVRKPRRSKKNDTPADGGENA